MLGARAAGSKRTSSQIVSLFFPKGSPEPEVAQKNMNVAVSHFWVQNKAQNEDIKDFSELFLIVSESSVAADIDKFVGVLFEGMPKARKHEFLESWVR